MPAGKQIHRSGKKPERCSHGHKKDCSEWRVEKSPGKTTTESWGKSTFPEQAGEKVPIRTLRRNRQEENQKRLRPKKSKSFRKKSHRVEWNREDSWDTGCTAYSIWRLGQEAFTVCCFVSSGRSHKNKHDKWTVGFNKSEQVPWRREQIKRKKRTQAESFSESLTMRRRTEGMVAKTGFGFVGFLFLGWDPWAHLYGRHMKDTGERSKWLHPREQSWGRQRKYMVFTAPVTELTFDKEEDTFLRERKNLKDVHTYTK